MAKGIDYAKQYYYLVRVDDSKGIQGGRYFGGVVESGGYDSLARLMRLACDSSSNDRECHYAILSWSMLDGMDLPVVYRDGAENAMSRILLQYIVNAYADIIGPEITQQCAALARFTTVTERGDIE